jgi:hypothetical protein
MSDLSDLSGEIIKRNQVEHWDVTGIIPRLEQEIAELKAMIQRKDAAIDGLRVSERQLNEQIYEAVTMIEALLAEKGERLVYTKFGHMKRSKPPEVEG